MKYLRGFIALVVLACSLQVGTAQEALPVTTLPMEEIAFGVYDPSGDFTQNTAIQIEQVFLPMRFEDATELTQAIEAIRRKNRFPLIALETWPWESWGMTKATLLDDLANGLYDSSIRVSCQAMAAQAPQSIWVRLDHEMDLKDLFPWSQGDPVKYIAAFRRFVTVCREEASNVLFMWSPAGDSRAMEYYPGDDVVDIIGLTVLGYEPWDLAAGAGVVQTMNWLFSNKWNLIYKTQKPVVIAELGVCCDPDHQKEWLRVGASNWSRYPGLIGVIYFQAQNPANSWGLNMTPDWRIPAEWFPPDY